MAFNRPVLQTILMRLQAAVNSRLDGADAFGMRYLLFTILKAITAAIHGLYGHQDYLSKQIYPNKDMDEDRLAEAALWLGQGMTYNAAAAATGQVTVSGNDAAVVPAGRVLQRSDGVEYAVDAEATIVSGTATLSVTATTAGQDTNAVAGQSLTFVSPVPGVQSSATVAAGGLTGGTDKETPEQLYTRLQEFVASRANGCNLEQYVVWAKEVPGVTRAWAFDKWLGVGTVGLFFVRDDDASIFPDAGEVQTVQDYIDNKRPPGLSGFTAYAPTEAPQDMTIGLSPDTSAVRAAVQSELEDVFRREAQVEDGTGSGTVLLTHLREAISIAAGENDHTLSLSADITVNPGELAALGNITWQTL